MNRFMILAMVVSVGSLAPRASAADHSAGSSEGQILPEASIPLRIRSHAVTICESWQVGKSGQRPGLQRRKDQYPAILPIYSLRGVVAIARSGRITALVGFPSEVIVLRERNLQMPTLAAKWNLEVDRGPDGLWVRVVGPASGTLDSASLADSLWSLLERHFVYRLVLDVEEIDLSDHCLVDQLTDLCERISQHDGMLRLCGLSPENREALDESELKGRIPCYRDREEAVMGGCPIKPR